MHASVRYPRFREREARVSCQWGAILALGAAGLLATVGCTSEIAKEFRSAAMGQIEVGVKAIADGVIDGIFSVLTPDDTGDSD